MKLLPIAIATAAALAGLAGAAQAGTVTFDDLASLPARTASTDLAVANNGSATYAGVVWDARFVVAGDEYRVDTLPGDPDPVFGLPKSGHYFVTNSNGDDGLTLTTTQVLTSAWFGQNAYYGYGNNGADQITISALHGSTVLLSRHLDLLNAHPGQASPLQLLDTSDFLTLSGITGYRIDRQAPNSFDGNWVGDNFVFQSPVPELSSAWLLAFGLGGLFITRSARRSVRAAGFGR